MKDYSEVINKYDNKKYAVSTLPLNKVRKVTYGSDKTIIATFKTESAVFKKEKTFLQSIFIFFSPVAMIRIADHSPLSQTDLHKLVCNLVENEQIGNLQLKETYIKHGYVTSQETAFLIWQMKKKSIINILF
jgi:hypothetical protein